MSNYLRQTHQSSIITIIRKKVLSKFQSTQPIQIQQLHSSHNIKPISFVPSPLRQRVDNHQSTIDIRVKELDNINNKIKSTLAMARSKSKQRFKASNENQTNMLYQKIVSRLDQNRSPTRRTRSPYAQTQNTPINKSDQQIKEVKFTQQELRLVQVKRTQSEQLQSDRDSLTKINEQAKTQKQKMVSLLLHQIHLDIKLRQSKQEYQCYANPQKQQQLTSVFANRGIQIASNEIDQLIDLHPEEYNPFFEASPQQNFKIQDLAESFLQAKMHWKKLKQSISIEGLQKEQFTIKQIDQSLKGFLSIEDLVTFINMNSQSFLRNRDAYSLFLRLKGCQKQESGQGRLSYQTFLNYVLR